MFSRQLLATIFIVAVINQGLVWCSTEEQAQCASNGPCAQTLMQQTSMMDSNSKMDVTSNDAQIVESSDVSMNEEHDEDQDIDIGGEDDMMDKWDQDKDGKVTKDEILAYLKEDGIEEGEVNDVSKELQLAFQKIDADGDGALNDQELQQLVQLFEKVDDDNDIELNKANLNQEETNSTTLVEYSGYTDLGNGKCRQSKGGNCDATNVYNTNKDKCKKICDCYDGCVGFHHKSGSSINPQGICTIVLRGFVKGGGPTSGGAKCYRNNARTNSRYNNGITHYSALGMCQGQGSFQLGSSYQGKKSRSQCEALCLSDSNCPGYSWSNVFTRHCYKHSGPGEAYKQGYQQQGLKCHKRGVNGGQGCNNNKVVQAKSCANNNGR